MDLDRTPTVLIVDDEETVAESYRMSLETECDVSVASNGGEALVELGSEIDVVLLDRRMPGMSGDEVLDHIRQWDMDCRVIMVSAVDPSLEDIELAYDEYITKPTTKDELLAAIEQALLLDRYEMLVSEYYEAKKKEGLYRSEFGTATLEGEEQFERLTDRIERLRDEIDETVSQFSDEAMVAVLRGEHHDR